MKPFVICKDQMNFNLYAISDHRQFFDLSTECDQQEFLRQMDGVKEVLIYTAKGEWVGSLLDIVDHGITLGKIPKFTTVIMKSLEDTGPMVRVDNMVYRHAEALWGCMVKDTDRDISEYDIYRNVWDNYRFYLDDFNLVNYTLRAPVYYEEIDELKFDLLPPRKENGVQDTLHFVFRDVKRGTRLKTYRSLGGGVMRITDNNKPAFVFS